MKKTVWFLGLLQLSISFAAFAQEFKRWADVNIDGSIYEFYTRSEQSYLNQELPTSYIFSGKMAITAKIDNVYINNSELIATIAPRVQQLFKLKKNMNPGNYIASDDIFQHEGSMFWIPTGSNFEISEKFVKYVQGHAIENEWYTGKGLLDDEKRTLVYQKLIYMTVIPEQNDYGVLESTYEAKYQQTFDKTTSILDEFGPDYLISYPIDFVDGYIQDNIAAMKVLEKHTFKPPYYYTTNLKHFNLASNALSIIGNTLKIADIAAYSLKQGLKTLSLIMYSNIEADLRLQQWETLVQRGVFSDKAIIDAVAMVRQEFDDYANANKWAAVFKDIFLSKDFWFKTGPVALAGAAKLISAHVSSPILAHQILMRCNFGLAVFAVVYESWKILNEGDDLLQAVVGAATLERELLKAYPTQIRNVTDAYQYGIIHNMRQYLAYLFYVNMVDRATLISQNIYDLFTVDRGVDAYREYLRFQKENAKNGYDEFRPDCYPITQGDTEKISRSCITKDAMVSSLKIEAENQNVYINQMVTIKSTVYDNYGNVVPYQMLKFSSDHKGFFDSCFDNQIVTGHNGLAEVHYIPTVLGAHSITVTALSNGYSQTMAVPIQVSDPNIGHDVILKNPKADSYQVPLGAAIDIQVELYNNGQYDEKDIAVDYVILDPNGQSVYSPSRVIPSLGHLGSSRSVIIKEKLSLGQQKGYHTITIQANNNLEADFQNNRVSISVFAGEPVKVDEYEAEAALLSQGQSQVILGKNITLKGAAAGSAFFSIDGVDVPVPIKTIKLLPGGGHMIAYSSFGSSNGGMAIFYFGQVSSKFKLTPSSLALLPGQTGRLELSSLTGIPLSRGAVEDYSFAGPGAPDASLIQEWVHFEGRSENKFLYDITIPENVEAKEYRAWMGVDYDDSDKMIFKEMVIQINENVKDAAIVYFNPSSGQTFDAGDAVRIDYNLHNNSTFSELIPFLITIEGSDGYRIEHTETRELKADQEINDSWPWDTSGLAAGQYTLSIETQLPGDSKNENNKKSSVITLNYIPPRLAASHRYLSLGSATVGTHFQSQFSVTNAGGGLLTGYFTNPDYLFDIVYPTFFSLAENKTQQVLISGNFPVMPGTFSGKIVITANSGSEEIFFSGNALDNPPAIAISTDIINLGDLTSSSPYHSSFIIQNIGGGTLYGALLASDGWISKITPDQFSLNGGEYQVIDFEGVMPSYSGNLSSSISVNSNVGQREITVMATVKAEAQQTGTIQVTTNQEQAEFSIMTNGRVVYQGSGDFWKQENVLPGQYTIVYAELAGLIKPPDATLILSAQETISFHGEYTPVDRTTPPTFSPGQGSYSTPQQVMINARDGAAIYYTIDGRDPNLSSPVYTSPIVVGSTTVVKAFAIKPGLLPSEVVSAEYIIRSGGFATPSLVWPRNNATGLDRKTWLKWNKVPDAASYDVQVDHDADFSSPLVDSTIYGVENASILIKSMEYNRSYNWRVRARRSDGYASEWSDVRIYMTMATVPAAAVTKPDYAIMAYLQTEDIYYIDRDLTIANIPGDLQGLLWIITDNDDKYNTTLDYLSLNLSQPSRIYVAVDSRTTTPPNWITSQYIFTGKQIDVNEEAGSYKLWFKDAAAGTTTLGGNNAIGVNPRRNQYFVLIGPSTTIPSTADPRISPASGSYDISQVITMSCPTADATIYYTLDNSTPTQQSTRYSGPIVLNRDLTVKALAVKEGYGPSGIVLRSYSMLGQIEVSTNLDDGNYSISSGQNPYTSGSGKLQTFRNVPPGSYRILFGTVPGYTKPANDGEVREVKTAQKTAFAGQYTSVSPVATPVISPGSGSFDEPVTLSISCATSGAAIRYTLDGALPVGDSPLYTAPFVLDRSVTVKACAFKSGFVPSAVAEAGLSFLGQVEVSTNLDNASYSLSKNNVVWTTGQGKSQIFRNIPPGKIKITFHPVTGYTLPANSGAEQDVLPARRITFDAVYDLIGSVAAPTFSPSGGTFTSALQINILCATPGAMIRYTLDGRDPDLGAIPFTVPITLTNTALLKARAYKDGMLASQISSASYKIVTTNEVTQVINFARGWNLIGFAVDVSRVSLEDLLKPISGHWLKFMTFKNGIWLQADPIVPSHQWSVNYVEIGQGYWVFMKEAANLIITAPEVKEPVIPLHPGWNMIGYPKRTPALINDVFCSIEHSRMKTLGLSNGIWIQADKSLPRSFWTLHFLESGKGYWFSVPDESELDFHILLKPVDDPSRYDQPASYGISFFDDESWDTPPVLPAGIYGQIHVHGDLNVADLELQASIDGDAHRYNCGVRQDGAFGLLTIPYDPSASGDKQIKISVLKGHQLLHEEWRTLGAAVNEKMDIELSPSAEAPGTTFLLSHAYPNPFNASTTVKFSVTGATWAEIGIYNSFGQKIVDLAAQTFAAGSHEIKWDGRDGGGHQVSSGVYICQIRKLDSISRIKLLLVR